jgi:UDP-N-acetylmuramoyl-tripeptide--D-alanyl-D-alanine ligase
MRVRTSDLLALRHLEFRGREALRGARIRGVCTDSRTLEKGDLFVALRGERFDGHAFVRLAFERGAVAAVAERDGVPAGLEGRPILVVENTLHALWELARRHRERVRIPVIAVAGSNGKTTTKEMIVRVLEERYRVLGTQGNLNNHVGVPLTLLRLRTQHQAAVVEIGTNHPGEVAALCGVVLPTHGVVTNVGREHLEFFGGLDGVAREEGALFAALAGRKGSVAFVNADDPHVAAQAGVLRGRKLTYGFTAPRAELRGRVLQTDQAGRVRFSFRKRGSERETAVSLAVPGLHHASNALAAAAVGLALKVSARAVRSALEGFRPVGKRMEVLDIEGVVLYNDTYNANPDSTMAALRTLAAAAVEGKRIAVLADMLELGAAGPAEHERIGREAAALGIDYLLTYGTLSRHTHDAASMKGALHYDQKNMLAEELAELIAPGDAVLVKGSRGMAMEDVVTFLQQRLDSAVVPLA